MKIVKYNGITFDSLKVKAGIPDDLPGPEVSPNVIERFGTTPLHAGLARGVRTIPVVFRVKPGETVEPTLMALLAALDPDDESERVLEGELNDGTDVYVYAAVGSWSYTSVDSVQVLFSATEPKWRKTTRTYSPGPATTDYDPFTANGSLTVTNAGQTTALPVVRLNWTGTNRSSGETTYLGWKYRRRISVTNTSSRTLNRYPIRLDLNDTKDWVDNSKALASGNDIRVIANGVDLPRTLLGHNVALTSGTVSSATTTTITVSGTPWTSNQHDGAQVRITSGALAGSVAEITNTTSNTITFEPALRAAPAGSVTFQIRGTWCWTILDEVAAGETVNLDIIYGNPQAGAPSTLGTLPNVPAIDLVRSSNETWVYNLRRPRTETSGGGLWHTSPIGADLRRVTWDVPAGWYRVSFMDNRDDRTQLRSTRLQQAYTATGGSTTTAVVSGGVGATDRWKNHRIEFTSGANAGQRRIITGNTSTTITFSPAVGTSVANTHTFRITWNAALFDAQRTWRNGARYPEEGAYDGVAFSHPLGITRILGSYRIINPAGLSKFIMTSRSTGSEDWSREIEDDTSRFTEATGQTISKSWASGEEPIQIGFGLIAASEVEISTDYARDSGTATAGTTNTLTDDAKEWVTDQWKNARVKIVGGRGTGSVRTVSSNTDVRLTVSSNWATGKIPNENSRYVVRVNHQARAALDGNFLTMNINSDLLTITAITAEVAVYDLGGGTGTNRLRLRMGGGSSADQYPYHQVWLGGPGRRLLLASGEWLEIDGENRTVRLYASGGGSFTSVPWVADFERVYKERTATLTARTVEWLPVRVTDKKLYVTQAAWGGSSIGLNVDLEEAFIA